MDWADAHAIAVHGHTLVWGQQLPQWLTSRSWSRAELRGVLRWYVTGVVRHFRGRVATWDVGAVGPIETLELKSISAWLEQVPRIREDGDTTGFLELQLSDIGG